MEGDKRRREILRLLSEGSLPVSGMELAGATGVSRQVIVQDIALLRATNKNILATNKGYVLYQEKETGSLCRRSIKVRHGNDGILEELITIVDCGGRVLNVVVEHAIYGQILVDLLINCREDAIHFAESVGREGIKPLTELTDGVHFHTIEAESEQVFDKIAAQLRQKGYLLN